MQDDKKLDAVLERFYNRFNKYNTKILKTLGETIKKFDGLTPAEAHQLGQELKFSTNINGLLEELSKISGKSIEDIDVLLDNVAKENVEFAEVYYEIKGKEYIPYEENDRLRRYVESIKQETYGTFKNIAKPKTIGFTMRDSNNNYIFKPLRKVYIDLIDEAVFNVSTGVVDYQSAMMNTIRQLADSGVKIHEATATSKLGYNRRIDSSVRQAVLTGLRRVNLGIQEQVGKEFGADGVELSAHFPCAEDHLDIQGRQFTNKEFEKLNSELVRPIGELNCTHFAFSIIMGVNLPSNSDEYLAQLKAETLAEFEYKGKTYNKYEASQVQRKLETAIRRQKDRQIVATASNNTREMQKAQKKITQLTKEYYNFSKKASLSVYKNRLMVAK